MIHLHELAKQGMQHKKFTITERLPLHVLAPCEVDVSYSVQSKDDFFLINLEVVGELHLTCQRCLDEFDLNYRNSTTVAVTRNDERAEQLLEQYECITSSNLQIDIEELVIDELHLYVPQYHQQPTECSNELMRFLQEKNATL